MDIVEWIGIVVVFVLLAIGVCGFRFTKPNCHQRLSPVPKKK